MSDKRTIKNALISVFHKDGLESIVKKLNELKVNIYSTGGTQKFIETQGISVNRVEDLTTYPSILAGRVKTLHPNIFGCVWCSITWSCSFSSSIFAQKYV